MNWFQKIFSLDEMKYSALVVILFIFVGVDIYSVIKYHDIPVNLAMITSTLIITIGGSNAIGWASSNIGNRYNTYPATSYNTTSTLPQTNQQTISSSMPKM